MLFTTTLASSNTTDGVSVADDTEKESSVDRKARVQFSKAKFALEERMASMDETIENLRNENMHLQSKIMTYSNRITELEADCVEHARAGEKQPVNSSIFLSVSSDIKLRTSFDTMLVQLERAVIGYPTSASWLLS